MLFRSIQDACLFRRFIDVFRIGFIRQNSQVSNTLVALVFARQQGLSLGDVSLYGLLGPEDPAAVLHLGGLQFVKSTAVGGDLLAQFLDFGLGFWRGVSNRQWTPDDNVPSIVTSRSSTEARKAVSSFSFVPNDAG